MNSRCGTPTFCDARMRTLRALGFRPASVPVVNLPKRYFRIADRDDERTRRENTTGKALALDRALAAGSRPY